MERWVNKVAIVTGASSGIGAAIAEELVTQGLKVVGIARREEKLEELKAKCENKKGTFYYVIGDIAKEEDIVNAFQWIKENVGDINILINNAGIGRVATVMEGNSEHIKDIFETNVFGLCVATREAVKEMQSNKIDGHIIHISSVLGHKVVRGNVFSLYSASKHAVNSLAESLKHELSLIGSKIKVSSISPGFVKTNFVDNSFKKKTTTDEREKEITEGFKDAPILIPKDISDAVVYVLSTGPNVQVSDLIIQPVGEAI